MDTAERQRRRDLVKRWRASGEPAREFGPKHGLAAWRLYDWAKAIARERKPKPIEFTEVRARSAAPQPEPIASAIEIETRGHFIRVRRGADLELLAEVLRVVARC